MKVVVIGGSGHIGSYLIPRLIHHGYEVTNVTRGSQSPYVQSGIWSKVTNVKLDREKEEKNGTFGTKIAKLKPDIVIDLISFLPESTYQIVEALKKIEISQYLFCGSIWVHGAATSVPATEDLPRYPLEKYGEDKATSEAYLHEQYRKYGFPETVILPGHITGPGWNCINPAGNFDPKTFEDIANGKQIVLPNMGMETVHHVHADDVAQAFMNSIIHREQALGESFHAVAPYAMTLFGFARGMYEWFGQEPDIAFLPWEEWCKYKKDQGYINSTYAHVTHSDNYSVEKGKKLIDFNPRYTIMQATKECVESMISRGVINVEDK